MTAFYIVLKVAALLAVIILPLFSPQKKKAKIMSDLGSLSINEGGYLEPRPAQATDHHPVQ